MLAPGGGRTLELGSWACCAVTLDAASVSTSARPARTAATLSTVRLTLEPVIAPACMVRSSLSFVLV
jgi:hypothetical protein